MTKSKMSLMVPKHLHKKIKMHCAANDLQIESFVARSLHYAIDGAVINVKQKVS